MLGDGTRIIQMDIIKNANIDLYIIDKIDFFEKIINREELYDF